MKLLDWPFEKTTATPWRNATTYEERIQMLSMATRCAYLYIEMKEKQNG
jgi:hypothetical protein